MPNFKLFLAMVHDKVTDDRTDTRCGNIAAEVAQKCIFVSHQRSVRRLYSFVFKTWALLFRVSLFLSMSFKTVARIENLVAGLALVCCLAFEELVDETYVLICTRPSNHGNRVFLLII